MGWIHLAQLPDRATANQSLKDKIPAGVTLPWHYHPVINAAVILDGTLELKSKNGMRQQYEPGDALVEVVNTLHSRKALGPKDLHLIVYAGEKGEPTTILKE